MRYIYIVVFLNVCNASAANRKNSADYPNDEVSQRRLVHPKGNHRIIGGGLARIESYPFMACLILKKRYFDKFRGGAVIIGKHWVLTAAHCMSYISRRDIRDKNAYVRSNSAFWRANFSEHIITEKYVHSKYDESTVDYDIAVLHIREPFEEKNEKPIKLPKSNYKYVDKSSATVLGWGTTNGNAAEYYFVDELRAVTIALITTAGCRKKTIHRQYNITDQMVCAGAPGKDSCVYDSGGPLVQNDILIGLVSWGPSKCADDNKPGVYTKVAIFYDWIQSIIKSKKFMRGRYVTKVKRKKRKHTSSGWAKIGKHKKVKTWRN